MIMRLISNRWVQVVLLLALLSYAVVLRLQDPPIVKRWRQLTFDTYNKVMPRERDNQEVIIVDIDEDSLRRYGQWPWSRKLVAKIPEKLRAMGAKVVAFDVVFSEEDRTSPHLVAKDVPSKIAVQLRQLPDNDTYFADKIQEVGNVVTGFVAANQKTEKSPQLKAKFLNEGIKPNPEKFVTTMRYFTTSLPNIVAASSGNGSFTVSPEEDGVVRKVPLLIGHLGKDDKVTMYPSLPLETLRVALGKSFYKVKSYGERSSQGYGIESIGLGGYRIPTDVRGNFYVHYSGHNPKRYISAWELLEDKVPSGKVEDKIVLVGTSAIGLLDLRSSPLDASLPGVEVHAEIIEQIIDQHYLKRPGYFDGAELWAIVIIGLGIIFLSPFIGTGVLAILGLVLVGGGGFGSLYMYQHFGYLFDPVYPTLIILVIFMLSSVLTNLRTEMERKAIKEAFGHYISKDLIEELVGDPGKLKLGGEVKELTLLFSDIRSFTTISESMTPAELIKMMNDFLTPMTDCVMQTRGTVDKYMGDAIMAFWNAPLDDEEHARNACKAALMMMDAMEVFNENFRVKAIAEGRTYKNLKAGVGLHTGNCSVGNMGSKQRFAYSALGDTVNLASRLEGQTKSYGVDILISGETYAQAPELAAIEVDLLQVKGKTEPVRIYALLGDEKVAQSDEFKEFKEMHDAMLEAYRAQEWIEATDLARRCKNKRLDLTGLYKLYKDRIAEFMKNTPPKDWDGVWIATGK